VNDAVQQDPGMADGGSPSPSPEFNACMDCGDYIKGACGLHGVPVRGTTLGRQCFKAKPHDTLHGSSEAQRKEIP